VITCSIYFLDACYPQPYMSEVITCPPDNTGVLQTISEVTARSPLSAELFSGGAAISLVGIYATICTIKKKHTDKAVLWPIVDASFAVGSLGFVGLTVWNLRVSGTVHSCFTAQTIVAVGIQIVSLYYCVATPSRYLKAAYGTFWFSGVFYIGYIIYRGLKWDMPTANTVAYFDVKYYYHAIGQFIYFFMYYVLLAIIAEAPETVPENDATRHSGEMVPLVPLVPSRAHSAGGNQRYHRGNHRALHLAL